MEHHSLHEAMQALLSSLFCDFYDTMQGWLYAAIAFILADLRFGILAAKKRGDEIRGSRMRRRTMNKVLDYSCWMFVAYTCRNSFGALFGVPVVSAAIVMYRMVLARRCNLHRRLSFDFRQSVLPASKYPGVPRFALQWKLLHSRLAEI